MTNFDNFTNNYIGTIISYTQYINQTIKQYDHTANFNIELSYSQNGMYTLKFSFGNISCSCVITMQDDTYASISYSISGNDFEDYSIDYTNVSDYTIFVVDILDVAAQALQN